MNDDSPKLPLPIWCFILLAVPTFYMPAAALDVLVWAMAGILAWDLGDPPLWLVTIVEPAIYLVPVMWPIYLGWVVFSKRLTGKEKVVWVLIVLLMNMVGMAVFYVFMVRRYLGLERRFGRRDEESLERFLQRHALARERFTPRQLAVLRSHCRTRRLAQWSALPAALLGGLGLFMAFQLTDRTSQGMSGFLTTRTVVLIDSAAGTRNEIVPDPQMEKQAVQVVMMFGAMAAGIGMMGLFFLAQSLLLLVAPRNEKLLLDFVKATNEGPPGDDSA